VNKGDLVKKVYEELNHEVNQKNIQSVIEAVFDNIKEALGHGEKVTMVGFGTFASAERKATTGKNPRTGEKLLIEAKYVAKFSPGKELKEHVHEQHKARKGK